MDNNSADAKTGQVESVPLPVDKCSGPTVQEVHIDFLLQEEFSVDPSFLRKFIEAAGQNYGPCLLESVAHSLTDQHGEADLLVTYRELEGSRQKVAILIEDKIRAGFQPRQADRYRERGKSRQGVDWDRYWTCLVAPASYIRPDHGFDAVVKLEQIKEWLAINEPTRRDFKVRILDLAIHKATTNRVQKVDPVMTAFRERYYAVFEELFADIRKDVQMRPPGPTWWGDYWFEIRSRLLPNGAYINHKSQAGCVDLTFPYMDAALLTDVKSCLEAGMEIELTGKSAAIRLRVCKVEQFNDFDRERPRVREGLSVARRLLEFYTREHARLEPILKSARTMDG